ncbi:MAG: hypothetical protein NTY80_04420 [candidate division SR1 bacterium]|nr:hypothetical protein [candidate division SR1 bacterium]
MMETKKIVKKVPKWIDISLLIGTSVSGIATLILFCACILSSWGFCSQVILNAINAIVTIILIAVVIIFTLPAIIRLLVGGWFAYP